MNILYDIGIWAYRAAIGIASPFNEKAKLWISGRWDWETKLRKAIGEDESWIWFHCSSLGEFEQGRPLIEAIKTQHPTEKILLTFFSPSGYEIRKGYPMADYICYLPLDTASNARVFLAIVQPRLVFFVKYDLWLHYIFEAHRSGIHLFLVSALVLKSSKFLTSLLRGSYKKAFHCFSWIFTQNEESAALLETFAEMDRISVAGDTRFDRVVELPSKFEPVPNISAFIHGRKCIVVGSTWPQDELHILSAIFELRSPNLCWIIAPHEIHSPQIDRQIQDFFPKMAKYSQIDALSDDVDVLWIDNVGMLSRLYHYSNLVYIGGGFGAGIHNIQEPAVYGNPVIFGPNYEKFQEAIDLVALGGAISIRTNHELNGAIRKWLHDPTLLAETRQLNTSYMNSKKGATDAILAKLRFLAFFETLPESE